MLLEASAEEDDVQTAINTLPHSIDENIPGDCIGGCVLYHSEKREGSEKEKRTLLILAVQATIIYFHGQELCRKLLDSFYALGTDRLRTIVLDQGFLLRNPDITGLLQGDTGPPAVSSRRALSTHYKTKRCPYPKEECMMHAVGLCYYYHDVEEQRKVPLLCVHLLNGLCCKKSECTLNRCHSKEELVRAQQRQDDYPPPPRLLDMFTQTNGYVYPKCTEETRVKHTVYVDQCTQTPSPTTNPTMAPSAAPPPSAILQPQHSPNYQTQTLTKALTTVTQELQQFQMRLSQTPQFQTPHPPDQTLVPTTRPYAKPNPPIPHNPMLSCAPRALVSSATHPPSTWGHPNQPSVPNAIPPTAPVERWGEPATPNAPAAFEMGWSPHDSPLVPVSYAANVNKEPIYTYPPIKFPKPSIPAPIKDEVASFHNQNILGTMANNITDSPPPQQPPKSTHPPYWLPFPKLEDELDSQEEEVPPYLVYPTTQHIKDRRENVCNNNTICDAQPQPCQDYQRIEGNSIQGGCDHVLPQLTNDNKTGNVPLTEKKQSHNKNIMIDGEIHPTVVTEPLNDETESGDSNCSLVESNNSGKEENTRPEEGHLKLEQLGGNEEELRAQPHSPNAPNPFEFVDVEAEDEDDD